ncbi:MAG: arginine--tRNA ligase [Patescibacteria group bacterium]|nr:arginine--tRNA ligase [Patescibacteria group bacterium]
MNILNKIKNDIAKSLNIALNVKLVKAQDIVYPPNAEMGDLSLPCFDQQVFGDDLSKLTAIVNGLDFVKGVSLAGKFMNISLDKEYIIKKICSEIIKDKKKYGRNKSGKKKRTMIEFTNANTHKQYHVGHVRNLCFGDSITKILNANGYKTFPVSYINDFGTHVAKTLWALDEFYKDEEIPENKGEFLGEVYARASKELEENKLGKQMVEGMMKKIEARKGKEYEKWQETRQWTIEQSEQIYRKMNVALEHIFYESEFIDEGRAIVNKLIKKRILRESQGAVIADLEKYDLGVQVVLRSDGTATYIVADLALAQAKFEKYKLDTSIYITDNRQSLHFKQMFKILELIGYKQKLVHLTHDFVKLPGGMIASRTGNIITFEELYQALFEKIITETTKRHDDWEEERIKVVAHILSVATIKFEMNKIGADQVITFDIKKALSFQGYTAAYLLYTYARIKSIFKKSGLKDDIKKINSKLLREAMEYRLIFKLAKYPEVVARAGAEYKPSEIARYLFELAQNFNDYYHQISVLKAEEEIKLARLGLLLSVAQVLENGFGLLGIETVEEM